MNENKEHPLRAIHRNMKLRCENPSHANYRIYGGRGIKVHKSLQKFSDFVEYIERELGPRPPGWTLDRIDVNGSYAPGNLRWASVSTQMQNRRKRTDRTYTTPFIGVTFDRNNTKNPYRAYIGVHREQKNIGNFPTAVKAAQARDRVALASNMVYGTSYVLNFPESLYINAMGGEI